MSTMWRATRRLITCIASYHAHQNKSGLLHRGLRRIARAKHLLFSILTSSDIDIHARLGEGLQLPHPTGVVIHEDAVIGKNCMIMQQVTIGQLSRDGAPTIGDNVYIGAGAKIFGPIKIGDRVRIGANAVVLTDVPSDSTAVGIPARIIRRKAPLL